MVSLAPITHERPTFALAYAWAGVAIMWAFWASFVIFLAEPRQVLAWWPLPTVDRTDGPAHPHSPRSSTWRLSLFGLQHSVMARPWFKKRVMGRMPEPLQRVTYVHMANRGAVPSHPVLAAIPHRDLERRAPGTRGALAVCSPPGLDILFLGAWSFGMRELLGIEQVMAWREGRRTAPRLKTGFFYRWLRHPMYVGVLLGMWATPRMSFGHLLLALAMTGYVLIAMRYEERDLMQRFGSRYSHWRGAA